MSFDPRKFWPGMVKAGLVSPVIAKPAAKNYFVNKGVKSLTGRPIGRPRKVKAA